MFARFTFAVKVMISISIVFVLSVLAMRYVVIGDRPGIDRDRLRSEMADSKELVEKTVATIKEIPKILVSGSGNDIPTVPSSELVPDDMQAVSVPIRFSPSAENKIASPLPLSSAPASLRVNQVLGTASAHPLD